MDTLYNHVRIDIEFSGVDEVVNILSSLPDIALDVHSESRGLGNGKTEVESYDTGNTSKTDENPPHLIQVRKRIAVNEGTPVGVDDDEGDKGPSELAPSLVGKHENHETAARVGGSKFGGDDRG